MNVPARQFYRPAYEMCVKDLTLMETKVTVRAEGGDAIQRVAEKATETSTDVANPRLTTSMVVG